MRLYSEEFLNFQQAVSTELYFVADTETTGLNSGEIVQLALIDQTGKTLIDTLVKPTMPIPPDATRIHGITDEMASFGRQWYYVQQEMLDIVRGKNLIIYNAVYDRKMMHFSDEARGLPYIDYKTLANFHCAMLAYAEFHGEWNDYRGSFRWQKLSDAARQQNLAVVDAHTALGDCLMTLGLIHVMKVLSRRSPRNPKNLDPQDLGLSS